MTKKDQVLELVLLGKSNEDIAKELKLTVSGVKYHVTNILAKSGHTRRTQLIAELRGKK